MRFEANSLLAGAAAGAVGVALGLPAVAQAISLAGWPSLVAAVALLAGAAWTLRPPRPPAPVPVQRRPEPRAMTAREWLDAVHVRGDLPPSSTKALISGVLIRQVQRPRMNDPLIEALFVALVSRGCASHDDDPRHARLTWLGLAVGKQAMVGPYERGPEVDRLCEGIRGWHAFDASCLLAAYDLARRRGATSTADFAWLRSVDRELWYAMDGLGDRNHAHPEGMGLLAHYREELDAAVPLSTPAVRAAIGPLLRIALERTPFVEVAA